MLVLGSKVLCHYRRFSERLYFCLQCGRPGFDPWVRKIPWRRKWQPTPVFLPGESHGWRSLVGYSPRVTKSQTRLSDFTFSHFVWQTVGSPSHHYKWSSVGYGKLESMTRALEQRKRKRKQCVKKGQSKSSLVAHFLFLTAQWTPAALSFTPNLIIA